MLRGFHFLLLQVLILHSFSTDGNAGAASTNKKRLPAIFRVCGAGRALLFLTRFYIPPFSRRCNVEMEFLESILL